MSDQRSADGATAAPEAVENGRKRIWVSRTAAWSVLGMLMLSIALNGFIGGAILARGGPGGAGPQAIGPGGEIGRLMGRELMRAVRDLDRSDRAVVRDTFRERRPDFEAAADRRRVALERARDVLAADMFDPAAFDAALGDAFNAAAENREVFRGVLLSIAADISPEGRQRLAELGP